MKTVKQIRLNNRIKLNYIVYERNDDGVLLVCTVENHYKSFITNISIDFNELDDLLNLLDYDNKEQIYDIISVELLNSRNPISEINITSRLGKELFIENKAA